MTKQPAEQIASMKMVASAYDKEDAGDVIDTNLALPYDVDLNQDIRFRVHWTSGSATTADTITWKVFYRGIVPDTTTIAAAATALDTVIAQDTVAGAYIWQATSWGVLKGGTLAHNVEKLMLQVKLDAFAARRTENIFPLGLEMAYSPKRLRGPDGMKHGAKLPNTMLGNAY